MVAERPTHCGEDYTGRKVNNWTILEQVGYGRGKKKLWQCRCLCGTEYILYKDNVFSNKSKACRICRRRIGENNPAWKGFKEIPHTTYSIMCKSATVRNIEVRISIEDLQTQWERQDGKCALSGLDIKLNDSRKKGTASIDRIDPAKGYVVDNIQWVHKDINLMKNKFSERYFVQMCSHIIQWHERNRLR